MEHNFFEINQGFFFPIIATIIFAIFVYTNHVFDKAVLRRLRVCLLSILLLIIADVGQTYFSSYTFPTIQRKIFASFAYFLRVAVVYSLVSVYFRGKSKKFLKLLIIPLILTAIVSLLAFVTPLVFYYTEDNEIVRGPLLAIPFIACIVYFVFVGLEAAKNISIGDPSEALLVIFIFVFSIVAVLMEMYGGYNGVVAGMCILSDIFYYIYFLSDNYTHDLLTNSFTRNKLKQDFSGFKSFYGVIMLDVNDLKKINDEGGHLAGDEALRMIANSIKKCLDSKSRLYRFGGDEFVIIVSTDNEEVLFSVEDNVNEAISETPYSVATGSVLSKYNEPIKSALERADELMYICKNRMKEAQNN